ncbi:DUF456 domain-containing protein [Aquipuribacter sp. SD81]|uniref:DUF456 domain-containing protein n=1 Tax=Aquipuribacter sp. SD81 TaxID=3127703 RepID=UPI00301A482B
MAGVADLLDPREWVVAAALVAMVVGLVGIVVPVLPGLALVNAAFLGFALYERDAWAWTGLAVSLALWAAAAVLQYYVPGKRLLAAGIPSWVLLVAGLAGVVGFFVVPVLGLPLFFVGAVYLVQSYRARHLGRSLGSTWQAVVAVVTSQAIELAAGVAGVVLFVVVVLV